MNSTINKIGFWSGLTAFVATICYGIVQLLQMYSVLSYPYDERLIYGTSLCIVIPFVLEMLALHYITPDEKKFWSHAALTFTILYAVFVTANYVVQLVTVIPMTLKGSLDEVRILQQTPHSLFWDLMRWVTSLWDWQPCLLSPYSIDQDSKNGSKGLS